jgi:hypothetical protein
MRKTKGANTMNQKNLRESLLAALKPKLWKYIVATLILVGMSHEPFEGLAMGADVAAEELMMGILGILSVAAIWVNYHFGKKTYMRNKKEIESLK